MRFTLRHLLAITVAAAIAMAVGVERGLDVLMTALFLGLVLWLMWQEFGSLDSWGQGLILTLVLVLLALFGHVLTIPSP